MEDDDEEPSMTTVLWDELGAAETSAVDEEGWALSPLAVKYTLGAGAGEAPPGVPLCLPSTMVVTRDGVGIGVAGNSFLVAAAGEEIGADDPCTRGVGCALKVAVSAMDGGVTLMAAVTGDELGVDTASVVEDVGLEAPVLEATSWLSGELAAAEGALCPFFVTAAAGEGMEMGAVPRGDDTAMVAAPDDGTGVAEADTEDTDTDKIDTVSTMSECSTLARVGDDAGADAVDKGEDVLWDSLVVAMGDKVGGDVYVAGRPMDVVGV